VMRVYRPDQAQIFVVDPHNDLLRVVEGEHLGRYVHQQGQIRELGETLGALFAERMPTSDQSQKELAEGTRRWSGPDIFVLIDHEETLATWDTGGFLPGTGYPLAPLTPYIVRGKAVGLHLVVSRRIAQWGRTQGNPMVGEMVKAKAAAIVMDGDPGEGPIIGDTIKAQPSDPGRGLYVTDRVVAAVQVAMPVRMA
jgi:hypothetical protein